SPFSSMSLSNGTRVKPLSPSRSRYSLSFPALPVAMTSRRSAKRCDGSLLVDDELLDALVGEREHCVELRPVISRALCGRLQLDQPPVLCHHAVQVGRSVKVFRVVEVEHGDVIHDAAADRGEVLTHRHLVE